EIVGGAAGDEGRFKGTYVGARRSASRDAATAVHVFGKRRWGVGVDHGLSPVSEPMRGTKAHGNVVQELGGRPAFDVYSDFARARGIELTPDNGARFLVNNELGIIMFDRLRKARAPLAVAEGGALVLAAEVPTGADVCILGGSKDELVNAAKRAAMEA